MAQNVALPTYKIQIGNSPTSVTTVYTAFTAANYTAIADVRTINGPSVQRDLVDVSHFDSPSNFREYMAGMGDGGDLQFDINLNPGSTTHSQAGANGLLGDFSMSNPRNWVVRFHPGQGVSTTATSQAYIFAGFMTDFTPSGDTGGALSGSCTIKIASGITQVTNAATI